MKTPTFDGDTIDQARDGGRLRRQYNDVFRAMSDGKEWTLARLSARTGHPEASISARIRDMRKEKFGGHTVERRFICAGLYSYRLIIKEVAQ